jgi:cell wall-associated NlpC family hydrolase
MDFRDRIVEYAKNFIGLPYIWGGDDPILGFDCSGFILELLASIGFVKRGIDYSAQGIFNLFRDRVIDHAELSAGCLIFWKNADGKIVHVALAINEDQIIHSAGGSETTKTPEDAIRENAYIREDVVSYRGNNYIAVDPFADG